MNDESNPSCTSKMPKLSEQNAEPMIVSGSGSRQELFLEYITTDFTVLRNALIVQKTSWLIKHDDYCLQIIGAYMAVKARPVR